MINIVTQRGKLSMKKLNNKGFTLIELLATVVIMLAISVLAVSSISAAIERNKVKQDEAKIEAIVASGKLYYEENKLSLGANGCIPLSALELTDEERKMSNGEYLDGAVYYNNGEFKYTKGCIN